MRRPLPPAGQGARLPLRWEASDSRAANEDGGDDGEWLRETAAMEDGGEREEKDGGDGHVRWWSHCH